MQQILLGKKTMPGRSGHSPTRMIKEESFRGSSKKTQETQNELGSIVVKKMYTRSGSFGGKKKKKRKPQEPVPLNELYQIYNGKLLYDGKDSLKTENR